MRIFRTTFVYCLAALFAVALSTLIVFSVFTAPRIENRLVITNNSGTAIKSLRIQVGDEKVLIRSVPDGEEYQTTFRIKRDTHFSISGALEDGSQIQGDYGYVTNGMYGQTARFTVKKGGQMQFEQFEGHR